MSTETLRTVLLYCTLINFGLLALWGLLFVLPHEWLYRWQGRRFRMSPDQFDALNAAGIGLYKSSSCSLTWPRIWNCAL